MTRKTFLIFEIIAEEFNKGKAIKSISIKNLLIKINLNETNFYNVEFEDNHSLDYKVYCCTINFERRTMNYEITIYFRQNNHYYCIGNEINNHSIEFLFLDFSKLSKYLASCSICYNNKIYKVKEQFKSLKTRKRISLINCDINKLSLPQIKQKSNAIKKIDKNPYTILGILPNCLISISKGTIDQIIGIYKNQSFYGYEVKKIEIIQKIKNFIKDIKDFLDYKEKDLDNVSKYINEIEIKDKLYNVKDKYKKALQASKQFNKDKEINRYFIKYIDLFDDLDYQIYELFSEYLLLFPEIYNKKIDKIDEIQIDSYIYQYYFSKKAINNLKRKIPIGLSKENKIRIEYSVCRTLLSLLANNFGKADENIFNFLDLTKPGTVYYDAVQNNIEFIDKLKENSEIFPFLLQLNSGSSSNYLNLYSPTLSSRFSMLTLDQVKKHLRKTIPQFILRVNFKCHFNASSYNETRIQIYSEHNIFGNSIDLDSKKDSSYRIRFPLSNIMKHEQFGHIKFSINNSSFQLDHPKNLILNINEPSSPIETYSPLNGGNFIEIYDPNSNFKKGESGYSFSYYLTRGNKKLYNFLENTTADFSSLFNRVDLLVSEDLTEFCKRLGELADKYGDQNLNGKEKIGSPLLGKYELSKKPEKKIIYIGFPTFEKY